MSDRAHLRTGKEDGEGGGGNAIAATCWRWRRGQRQTTTATTTARYSRTRFYSVAGATQSVTGATAYEFGAVCLPHSPSLQAITAAVQGIHSSITEYSIFRTVSHMQNHYFFYYSQDSRKFNQPPASSFETLHALSNTNTTIPFEKSFACRLYGSPHFRYSLAYPLSRISDWTGKPILPYIWKDLVSRPPRLRLMLEIKLHRQFLDNRLQQQQRQQDITVSEAAAVAGSTNITNNKVDASSYTPIAPLIDYEEPPISIDYVPFHRIHLEQVNEALSQQFWPGIDGKKMIFPHRPSHVLTLSSSSSSIGTYSAAHFFLVSESLLYPDYSIVALYRRVVVGCAFMMPECYITYFMVRPGWQRSGIGRFMLFYLTQVFKIWVMMIWYNSSHNLSHTLSHTCIIGFGKQGYHSSRLC